MNLPRPTQRLRFRPRIASDVDLLMILDSDPEVMRFIDGGRAPDAADIAATIERVVGHRWVASDPAGTFVGWFGLVPTGPGEAELGYRLARARWGQGLATEGATELVRFGFDDHGLRRVWAQTMTVNAASRRVLEKSGLRHVGTFFANWPDVIEGNDQGDAAYEITSATHRIR